MVSKIQLTRIAGHQREEVRRFAIRLGAQDSAESLRFLLPRTERSRYLDEHMRVRQVDCKVADLGKNELLDFAAAKLAVQFFALLVVRRAGNQRNIKPLLQAAKLPQVLADHQN